MSLAFMELTGNLNTRDKSWWLPLLVCVCAALAYSAVPTFQFVYDDRVQVLDNPTLLHLASIPQYFRQHTWSYVPDRLPTYYRPLFSMWLNLNYALFGLNPAGWHVALLGLHVVASLLTFYVVSEVFGNRMIGLLAALIFAVHPVHTESVAWISGATDPLASVFILGCFLMYRRSQREKTSTRIFLAAASVACFACAILVKEAVLLFPLILLVDSFWLTRNNRPAGAIIVAVLPYFLVSAGYFLARFEVLGGFGRSHVLIPVRVLFYTLPSVLLFYLGKLLLPINLSAFYDTPYVDHPRFWHFWLPLLVLLALTAVAAVGVRHLLRNGEGPGYARKLCGFFLLWAALFLLPALDLWILDAGEIAHDRYLYLPSIGFFAVLAYLLQQAAAKLAFPKRLQAGALAALVLLLGTASVAQSRYWKNDLALYSRGAALAPSNLFALNNLANMYLETGDFKRGIALHRKILEKYPSAVDSYYNIGMAYYNEQDYPQARTYFQQAVLLRGSPPAYFYLGMSQLRSGQTEAAEVSFQQALRGAPNQPKFHVALGAVYESEGKLAQALEEFESAIRMDPNNQPVRREIDKIKQQLGL